MILKYGNITLRPIEKKDSALLLEMINSPEIGQMTGAWSVPVSSYNQDKWIENYKDSYEMIRWMIELDNGVTIGMVSLSDINWISRTAFLNYKINPLETNRLKGDTKNAVYIAVKFAFDEMGLHRIEGHILTFNIMSIKLIESIGFVKEGVFRSRVLKNGKWCDQACYGLLDDEFQRYEDGTAPWQVDKKKR